MEPEAQALRTSYHLGLYDEVLKEVKDIKSRRTENVEIYYFRALMERNADQVVRSIPTRASTALLAIKQMAIYRTSSQEGKEQVLETLNQWLGDDVMKTNATLQLVAAEIYFREENYRAALPLVHGEKDNLEKMALAVLIFLKLNRVDLAQKMVEAMFAIEDDDCLTVLCTAFVAAAQAQEAKLEQAKLSLDELVEKHGPSVVVYNALASVQLVQRKYPAAFNCLKNARETAKKLNQVTPAETLINTAVCLQHMNKTQFVQNILTELEQTHPNHPWLASQRQLSEAFKQCASTYS